MELWNAFVGAFFAIALKDIIDSLWYLYQKKKRRSELQAFLDHLEDEEADDDDEE